MTTPSARVSAERPFSSRHADAYDLLITDPVEPWVDAVHDRLVRAGRPRARVLDAGCGTGRHAGPSRAAGSWSPAVSGAVPRIGCSCSRNAASSGP